MLPLQLLMTGHTIITNNNYGAAGNGGGADTGEGNGQCLMI